MTVSNTGNRQSYTGDGSATVFAFPYKFLTAADLKVYVGGVLKSLGSDYSVGSPTDTGAAVTLTSPPSLGVSVVIVRDPDMLQQSQLPSTGPFPAKTVETMVDKAMILIQRLRDLAGRSVTLADSDATGPSLILPTPQADRLLGWNNAANQLINIDQQAIATVVAYGTANADIFTGDGTTLTWELREDPVNLNNLDVSIGGVTQLPGLDYTWESGTTLTTIAPVPAGVRMLVRYMQGLPQAATGLPNMAGNAGKALLTDGVEPYWSALSTAAVDHTASYTGAVKRSLLSRLNEVVNVCDFGADPTGVADSTAAFQAAIATGRYTIIVPEGTFKLTASLTMIGGQRLVGVGKRRSVLDKAFNGTMIIVPGGYIGIFGLYLNGNGATWTGKGIDVNNAASPYFEIDDCRIIDFHSSCIDFSVPEAGSQTSIRNSQIYCNTITRPAITLPGSAFGGTGVTTVTDTAATPRFFFNLQASGGTLIDFGNCDNATVANCWSNGFLFGTSSRKVIMSSVRMFNGGGAITIKGLEHNITGLVSAGSVYLQNCDSVIINNCVVAGELTLSGAANYRNKIARTFAVAGVVDFDGDPTNYVDIPSTDYTPTWLGATTNPTIGNGTLQGNWRRVGLEIMVNITLTYGSTSTPGVGVWTFSLPFRRDATARGPCVGHVFLKRNGVSYSVGAMTVNPGDNVAQVYAHGGTAAIQAGTPWAWANGDLMQATLIYSIK